MSLHETPQGPHTLLVNKSAFRYTTLGRVCASIVSSGGGIRAQPVTSTAEGDLRLKSFVSASIPVSRDCTYLGPQIPVLCVGPLGKLANFGSFSKSI